MAFAKPAASGFMRVPPSKPWGEPSYLWGLPPAGGPSRPITGASAVVGIEPSIQPDNGSEARRQPRGARVHVQF